MHGKSEQLDQSHSSQVELFRQIRQTTERLCESLQYDDFVVQSAPFVSPPKWHLGHTTWFFEHFILDPYLAGYRRFHPKFGFLFNSYYQTVGKFQSRPNRGLLSRPTVEEVFRYRRYVDEGMSSLLQNSRVPDRVSELLALGCAHEEQHQELLLMDIKHILYSNPLKPEYLKLSPSSGPTRPLQWKRYSGQLRDFGHSSSTEFAYDNESPRHPRYVGSFQISDRLVTNGEYLEFMEDGGYERPELWLSDGWDLRSKEHWEAPFYWDKIENKWWAFTLGGPKDIEESQPVAHLSYYEAHAYACWSGKRLPTEFEWELTTEDKPILGNFLENGVLEPTHSETEADDQFFGDLWEWTQSPYQGYPGYQAVQGSLGEYNGKFMCNQLVLRGGAFATPKKHLRSTYRNFYNPAMRWQFSGLRLASDL